MSGVDTALHQGDRHQVLTQCYDRYMSGVHAVLEQNNARC